MRPPYTRSAKRPSSSAASATLSMNLTWPIRARCCAKCRRGQTGSRFSAPHPRIPGIFIRRTTPETCIAGTPPHWPSSTRYAVPLAPSWTLTFAPTYLSRVATPSRREVTQVAYRVTCARPKIASCKFTICAWWRQRRRSSPNLTRGFCVLSPLLPRDSWYFQQTATSSSSSQGTSRYIQLHSAYHNKLAKGFKLNSVVWINRPQNEFKYQIIYSTVSVVFWSFCTVRTKDFEPCCRFWCHPIRGSFWPKFKCPVQQTFASFLNFLFD